VTSVTSTTGSAETPARRSIRFAGGSVPPTIGSVTTNVKEWKSPVAKESATSTIGSAVKNVERYCFFQLSSLETKFKIMNYSKSRFIRRKQNLNC
jgi:hypothetical protein